MLSLKIKLLKNGRKSLFLLLLIGGFISSKVIQAQSYYGYQSISKHTFLFSLIWQGEPKIGFGYIDRIYGGKTFTDLQTEIRFPLKSMFRFEKYDAIAGIYKPLAFKRRFTGFGAHLRWNSELVDKQRVQKLSLATTLIPSYVYAAPLDDGLYGTIGLRLTYAPVIFAISKNDAVEAAWTYFPYHKFEGGIHYDMLIDERSLGLSINASTSYFLNITDNVFLKDEVQWEKEGDVYFGPTYRLNRD